MDEKILIKRNMKQLKISYKSEFVDKFKVVCSKLGVTQSEILGVL
jgi:hypothetical protein